MINALAYPEIGHGVCRWFCYLLSELGKQWQFDGHILIRLGNGPLCPVPLSTIVVGPPQEDGIIINT